MSKAENAVEIDIGLNGNARIGKATASHAVTLEGRFMRVFHTI